MLQKHLKETVKIRKKIARPEGIKYFGIEDYVLKKGKEYLSAPLTNDEMKFIFDKIDCYSGSFKIKQCYYNSQMLLCMTNQISNPNMDLKYVEGYAVDSSWPVHHGWLSLNGKVIDVTMRLLDKFKRTNKLFPRRLANRVFGEFPEDRAYYGVEFETVTVLEALSDTGMAGTLIDDWQRGWPLLRN